MTAERDPRLDPHVGDFIAKMSGANKRLTRLVVKRKNFDIMYRDHNGTVKTCWITSWQDWARLGEVEKTGK
jgi:hypothetical protein